MRRIGFWGVMCGALLLTACTTPNLKGKWAAQWPDGHTGTVDIQNFGDGEWYFRDGAPEIGGIYQVDESRLICIRPDSGVGGIVWRILDSNHLVLIEQPPVDKLGGRWLGLELTWVPPPHPPEEQTDDSDDDSALPKHPPPSPPPSPPPVDKP